MNTILWLMLTFWGVIFLLIFGSFLLLIPIWIKVWSSSVPVSPFQLIAMKLRGLQPEMICNHLISLHKTGIPLDSELLEAHVLSGGDLHAITEALIAAKESGLPYDFHRISAIDLAGRDVLDAVRTSVEPKILTCPDNPKDKILGVAKDGIRLQVSVRITVRTNFDRLIGGANEKTIIARVGEGIVSAVGAAESHKSILEKPDHISRYILERGLDRASAFEIVSVDVSEVKVIDNIGARLQEIQAEVDKQVAQAKSEMRRAGAVAREREMKAKVVEMTSQLIFARSILPKEVASAYLKGKIWRNPRPVVSSGIARHLWDCCDS